MLKRIILACALLAPAHAMAQATLSVGSSGNAGQVVIGNATSGTLTIKPTTGALGSTNATFPVNTGTALVAEADFPNAFLKPQSTNSTSPSISTSTFTPDFTASQNFRIVLVHASCPCTLANPAALTANVAGMFEIVQSATGSDTIGTWGSEYVTPGGTSTITLSTGANVVDYIPYKVDSTGTVIVLGAAIKNPVH